MYILYIVTERNWLFSQSNLFLKEYSLWFLSAYTIAKYGMSMCVLGMAEEFKGEIAVNALWPKTGMYLKKYIYCILIFCPWQSWDVCQVAAGRGGCREGWEWVDSQSFCCEINFLLYIQGSFQLSGFDLDDWFSADCHARNINTVILAESQESQQEAICSSLTFSPSLSSVSY